MKKIIFALAAILTIGFLSSCNKSDNEISSTDVLIEEIATSSSKQNIDPEVLPATTKSFIEDEHFETYIESVAFVDGRGYEIILGTEDVEYFNVDGTVLRTRLRPHGCHRPGPCGGGQRIALDELPETITTYITENYPDQEIRRAKIKGDYYLVAITGPTILVFENDGTFVTEAPLFRFCFANRIDIENLSDTITNYITENCPDGEIKVAFNVRGKIAVGILTPDGRKIFFFNSAGEFLFERS